MRAQLDRVLRGGEQRARADALGLARELFDFAARVRVVVWERARVSKVEALLPQLLEERARVSDAAEGRDRPRRDESLNVGKTLDVRARVLFAGRELFAEPSEAARADARGDDARASQPLDFAAPAFEVV